MAATSTRAARYADIERPSGVARSLCSTVVAGDPDVKRKRQLILLSAAGVVIIVLALGSSVLPVNASFEGEPSYNCGSPFRRWRNPKPVKSQWTEDTLIIVAAYPETELTRQTPLLVCEDKVQFRYTVMKVVIVLALLVIAAAIGLYWHLYGFIYDPHV
jgi:hypothetical protein